MGFFYTDQLRARLNLGADLNGKVFKITLLARAPQLDDDDGRTSLRGATTLAGLLGQDGWQEVASANYAPQNVTPPLYVSGNNNYVQLNTSLVQWPANMERTPVQAMVLSVNGSDIGLPAGDRVLFGTTTPFGEGTIFQGGDGISARVDTGINRRWLFGYAVNAGVVTSIVEGTTVIQQGAPPYEVSHVCHSWLIPQRVNYIANPSWEGGVTHWQTTNGAMTRTVAVNDFPSHWLGHAIGTAASAPLPQYAPVDRLYVKSNAFYPRQQEFSFQIMARGTGIARVGLSYWPRDYSEHAADWGLLDTMVFEEWKLNPTNFIQLRGVRRMSDGYEGSLLIEVRRDALGGATPEVYLDLGLLEEGVLLDWPYFDGDSTYGGPDDFSWYGDVPIAAKRGKSYSFWYNSRRSIGGRLFGRRLDDTQYYTSADEQLDSLVSQWTPAGAVVFPHWDVLVANDLQILPIDRSATTLVADSWPEAVQPFAYVDISNATPTSADLTVVGEGAYPITGAYMLSGTTASAATIDPRTYNPDDLYDLSKPQMLHVSWPAVPAFQVHTLYLQRGDPQSPLSWLAIPMLSSLGSAVLGVGVGSGQNASVRTRPTPDTAPAVGVAFPLISAAAVTIPAGAAAATGVANITSARTAASGNTATAAGTSPDAAEDGYVLLPGTAGNAVTFSRSALGSVTTIGFALRASFNSINLTQALAGWSGGGGGLTITGLNNLNIGIARSGGGTIGGGNSSATIPGIAANTKVWLMGSVTVATGVCQYFYSYSNTNDYDAVVWTGLGSNIAGTAGAVDLTKTTTPIWGATTLTAAGYAGKLYAGAEILNGVKTIEFDASDFPPS